MPRRNALALMDMLEDLDENPRRQDMQVTRLQGRAGYRIRSGDYRAIFEYQGDDILVLNAGPRGGVYRR